MEQPLMSNVTTCLLTHRMTNIYELRNQTAGNSTIYQDQPVVRQPVWDTLESGEDCGKIGDHVSHLKMAVIVWLQSCYARMVVQSYQTF